MGKDMVENRPFALIFVSARFEFGSAVNEVVTAGEEFELWGIGFSIEVAHDDEVGMMSDSTNRIYVFLELLTDAHAQFLSFSTTTFGGKMEDIYIKCIATCDGACHVQDVACSLFGNTRANVLGLNGMEGEGRVE